MYMPRTVFAKAYFLMLYLFTSHAASSCTHQTATSSSKRTIFNMAVCDCRVSRALCYIGIYTSEPVSSWHHFVPSVAC